MTNLMPGMYCIFTKNRTYWYRCRALALNNPFKEETIAKQYLSNRCFPFVAFEGPLDSLSFVEKFNGRLKSNVVKMWLYKNRLIQMVLSGPNDPLISLS